jgi:hypothetical protein
MLPISTGGKALADYHTKKSCFVELCDTGVACHACRNIERNFDSKSDNRMSDELLCQQNPLFTMTKI